MEFKVVCVNDKFRPDGYPVGIPWLKSGTIYTVIETARMAYQHNSIGYKLQEINMPEDSLFQFFMANRFRPVDTQDLEAEQAVKEMVDELFQDDSVLA